MSHASNQSANAEGKLGLWDAVSIIVGIVIGTSIFMVPVLIFSSTPNWESSLLVWIVGGVLALVGAFCYSELATTYPRAGGDYYYLSRAFGPGTGFLFGWAQLVVVMPASIGTMCVAFAYFFQKALADRGINLQFEIPFGEKKIIEPTLAISCYVVVVLTLINILGLMVGKTVQNLLAFAKLAGLLAIVIAGFGWPQDNAWAAPKGPMATTLGWDSLALILVMYAFGGWNDAAFVAAEVRQPQRNIPRALLYGVGIITCVYVLVNVAYINGLGFDRVSHFGGVDAPLQLMEETSFGAWAPLAMAIIVMVSALGAANGLILTGPRVYATLGGDHKLFGWLGHWKPGGGAPVVALLLQAVLTLCIIGIVTTAKGHNAVLTGLNAVNEGLVPVNNLLDKIDRELPPIDTAFQWSPRNAFETLISRNAPVFWVFFLLTGLSLFVLRDKNPGLTRPYSVPLYPVVPIIFICSCGWMLYRAIIYAGWSSAFAVVLVLVGLPLYYLSCLFGAPKMEERVEVATSPRPKPAMEVFPRRL